MSVATKCYGTMQPSSSVISVIPGRPGASADSIDSVESAPDLFNPPIESPLRRSSVIAATFNLTNTLLGGGTLSFPFVFAKCGAILATTMILFSMVLSLFSLNIICQLSQKLGCTSYSEVIEKTLGRHAKQFSIYCLMVMLLLVVIAYLVLLRDVSSELFEYFTPDSYEVTILTKNLILTLLAVITFPLMTCDSLHALRYTSYCGTTCILFLLGCLCVRTYQKDLLGSAGLQEVSVSASDVLTSLPITFIGFLCHFNVNGIFCDLEKPHKIKNVTRCTVTGAAVVFFLFGLVGYMFAGQDTADNVLKNFSSKDPVLMAARLGLTVTLMSQLPVMVIPCRKTLYPLLWPETNLVEKTQRRRAHSHDIIIRRLSSPPDQHRDRSSSHSALGVDYFSTDGACEVIEVEQGMGALLDSSSMRYGLSFLILTSTLIVAQSLPSVSVVWSVMGSSLTLIICYLLPAAAYITFWKRMVPVPVRVMNFDVLGCYAMFAAGVILMIVCTPQAMYNAFHTS